MMLALGLRLPVLTPSCWQLRSHPPCQVPGPPKNQDALGGRRSVGSRGDDAVLRAVRVGTADTERWSITEWRSRQAAAPGNSQGAPIFGGSERAPNNAPSGLLNDPHDVSGSCVSSCLRLADVARSPQGSSAPARPPGVSLAAGCATCGSAPLEEQRDDRTLAHRPIQLEEGEVGAEEDGHTQDDRDEPAEMHVRPGLGERVAELLR